MREPGLDEDAELARLLGEVSELKAAVQREGEVLFESWGIAVAGSAALARAEGAGFALSQQSRVSFVKVTQRPAAAGQNAAENGYGA